MFHLLIQIVAIALSCSDVTSQEIGMQRTLMHNLFAECINASAESAEKFRERIAVQRATEIDPCTWKGMQCTNGVLTTVVMSLHQIFRNDLYIDMGFFPSSVQFLHLNRAKYLDGWAAERLPRDLKYFCAHQCYNAFDKPFRGYIRMEKLPSQMEEIHLSSGTFTPPSGLLFIASLPSSLRICDIRSRFLSKVYVNDEGIPDGIHMLNIYGNGEKLKILETQGKKLSNCVTHDDVPMGMGSAYYADLDRKALDLSKDLWGYM